MAYEIARSITSGRRAVTLAGTAEQLVSTSTSCYRVDISADLGNVTPIVTGGSNVVAANGSQVGVVLTPGNPPLTLLVDDVSKVYIDAQTDGDAACFVYYQA